MKHGEILTGPQVNSTWDDWHNELREFTKDELLTELKDAILKKKSLGQLSSKTKVKQTPYTYLDCISRHGSHGAVTIVKP